MSVDVGVHIMVSPDHMELTAITLTPQGIAVAELYAQIEQAGVHLSPELDEQIKKHLSPDGRFVAEAEICLLRGTPALDDVPAALKLEVGAGESLTGDKPSENGVSSVDHYTRNSFITVKQDQVIGTIVAYSRGVDGRDIFGKTIPRKSAASERVTVGKNAHISEDGKKVIAGMTGCVHTDRLKVWVEPQLDIPKDVDFSTGHIAFEGDVVIGRNILDLFKVKVSGNLNVGGAVEAAEVTVGHDLSVNCGIVQKEKGFCKAGGAIHARYVSNSHLESLGDITVRKEIANSRINSGGKITVESGPLMGGHTVAKDGLVCASLGSQSCVRTLVELGVDESLRKFPTEAAPEIEAQYKRILTIRNDIAPLLSNQKTLNAQQKERITELMFEASETEAKLKAELAIWREKLHNLSQKISGDIIVHDMLYPGVILRFGAIEATISTAVKGPMKICLRATDHDRSLVLINTLSGSVRVLEAHHYHDDALEQARKLLEEKFKL